MAKERSNRKFDFSKSDVSRFDFTKDEKEELEVAPAVPSPNPKKSILDKINETIKNHKLISGAIAASVICLLCYGTYSVITRTDDNTEIIAGGTSGGTTDGGTTAGGTTDGGTTDGGTTDGGITDDGTTDGGTTDGGTTNNSSIALSGTLEEKAKDVIRGNYGNGEVRKQKLGDQYAEIQGKVNEMYRNGLVK